MIQRKQTHSKSMYDPLGLQLQFSCYWCAIGFEFIEHFFGIIESPCCVVCYIKVMLWFVKYSSLSTRNQVSRLELSQFLLCLCHPLQVIGMLFLVYIVWEFVKAKLIYAGVEERRGSFESLDDSHGLLLNQSINMDQIINSILSLDCLFQAKRADPFSLQLPVC